MKVRLSIEFRLTREQTEQPPEEGPAGTESMIIHQEQPRYIGFRADGVEDGAETSR